jgi:hypothetical protein
LNAPLLDAPLLVQILAYAPNAFYHCTHCEVAWREMGMDNHIHEEQTRNSLPPDLAQEYQRISDWVRELFKQHCDRVVVKVVDVASIEGFFKALRYGIHRYPAVIIEGKTRFNGSALEQASLAIAQRLERET